MKLLNDTNSPKVTSQMTCGPREIVVADAAYPAQSNPAIQTITVDTGQLETVEFVLGLIEEANHVDATTYLDLELAYVDDGLAPGANDYRDQLKNVLNERPVVRLGHEDIIRKLDQSSDLFQVLILKTDLTIPYTSVFFQLECGYWDAEAEAGLRKVMESQMESK